MSRLPPLSFAEEQDHLASRAREREGFRQEVKEHLAALGRPDDRKAVRALAPTLLVYASSLVGAHLSGRAALAAVARNELLPALGLGALAAAAGLAFIGAAVRSFLLHHDLCHRSFFTAARWNEGGALLCGTLVSTSPSVWSREHQRHHLHSNDLGQSQDGQTAAWTVEQYLAAPAWQRAVYWTLNQRPVLYGVLPPLYFFGFMRIRARWHENLAFAAFAALLWQAGLLGLWAALVVPASWLGFLLFHAQHTFEGTWRRRGAEWNAFDSAMKGASIIVLPEPPLLAPLVRWATFAVGIHALHHLNLRVAGYALPEALAARPELFATVPRVTLGDAVRATRYALYDEREHRLVTLAEAAARARPG